MGCCPIFRPWIPSPNWKFISRLDLDQLNRSSPQVAGQLLDSTIGFYAVDFGDTEYVGELLGRHELSCALRIVGYI